MESEAWETKSRQAIIPTPYPHPHPRSPALEPGPVPPRGPSEIHRPQSQTSALLTCLPLPPLPSSTCRLGGRGHHRNRRSGHRVMASMPRAHFVLMNDTKHLGHKLFRLLGLAVITCLPLINPTSEWFTAPLSSNTAG